MTPAHALEHAVVAANRSTCAKSRRGVVIFRDAGIRSHHDIVADGCNAPPIPFSCDGSPACRAACGRVAVHAEQAALLHAANLGRRPDRAEMLHVKVVDGLAVPSGGPSCVDCSKLILEAGLGGMWLLHTEGLRRYEPVEFHRLTLETLGLHDDRRRR